MHKLCVLYNLFILCLGPVLPAAHDHGGLAEQRVDDGRGPAPGLQVWPVWRGPQAAHCPRTTLRTRLR